MLEREKSGKKKILVVEDEAVNQRVIERTIQGDEYHLLISGSSEEALFKFQSEPISHVLTDVNLGESLTGLDLARTFKLMNPNVKIVVMSSDETNEGKVGDWGVFLKKPFTKDELSAAFDQS